ncbi:hypothetical protein ACTFIZ_007815 [Dictyostelium cf. discoideum]
MCNSIILENKIFDSQWDNKNHTLFENLIPRNNNNLIENDNNNNNNNNNNFNNNNDNDINESFYNSNIPNESQLNKYSRFGFKPSQPISNKNENQIEINNNILSFSIKSFLLLILYILFFNYQLYSKYFIILLSLNFIITLISIKSIFKFKNLRKLNNILIYKIKSKIIILN